MKTRHVVAIGILTAIAVGLLAIGIKITGQKPKVQTSAYGNVTNYNYTNKDTTIYGVINQDATAINTEEGRTLVTSGTYTINKTRNIIGVELSIDTFFDGVDEWNVNPPLVQTYLFTTDQQIQRIIITQSTIIYDEEITGYYINYIVQINNLTPKTYSLAYQNADYSITETQEEIQLEYSNFSTTINTINSTYETAYTTGYQTKGDLSDGNFATIQETMLNVLTMPFTFISQGFNVTLWEGTPYAINIGNFIKSLIAIATILFIIKMFTSGFSVIGNYTTGTGANISQWRKNRSERKLNESKARLNDRTNPNHKTRDSHVTIKKE